MTEFKFSVRKQETVVDPDYRPVLQVPPEPREGNTEGAGAGRVLLVRAALLVETHDAGDVLRPRGVAWDQENPR